VRIADHEGKALPDKTVGRVLIHGGNVTRGYYQDEQATRLAVSADGWVDTGDLGFMHEAGLVITGRLKDIIFVNGQNLYPQDIEALLAQHAGIDLGTAAVSAVRPQHADADEMLVFVLHRGSMEAFVPVVKDVRRHVNEQTGVVVDRVVPVSRIPKTTSGKIQRYLLAQEFQVGAFTQALAELNRLLAESSAPALPARTRIERELKEICDSFLKDKPLGVNDNIFVLGTSSLTLAQIYQRIEAIYPGQIEVTDFFDYPTIAELAGYLEKRLAAT
jgi:acyl carrier protein